MPVSTEAALAASSSGPVVEATHLLTTEEALRPSFAHSPAEEYPADVLVF